MANIALIIINIILILIILGLWYYFPECDKCPECKKCDPLPSLGNFLSRATVKYEQNTIGSNDSVESTPVKKRSCRLDQDSKNVFSTFFKHQCKKTPYTNF